MDVMTEICLLQDRLTAAWHDTHPGALFGAQFSDLVAAQHKKNFELWHLEDEARAATELAEVGAVKRSIDVVNQERNNLMEDIDACLMGQSSTDQAVPLHSETPGMMIDRLSILSLKIYHMHEQTTRTDADAQHKLRCGVRKVILVEQRTDLCVATQNLLDDIMKGKRRFKVYKQMKMYNDNAYRSSK